jgi:3-phosphoshikimate 1-carboxyvinyltransferase
MTIARVDRALRAPPRLRGTIELPSDKSIAHRAHIFSALAAGESQITVREPGQDVLSTRSALTELSSGTADCGNSGTTMRLIAGLLASREGVVRLTGDASLSRRPMERVAAPLRLMGADVETTDGHAPLTIRGKRPLRAIAHELPVASAQVLAAICIAALAADGTTRVIVPGPTRDHTERMLGAMGADIRREGAITTVAGPTALRPLSISVPGDFSSAAAWLVAATVHPDALVTLESVGLNPTRTALVDILREMGADIAVTQTSDEGGEPAGDIVVRSAKLHQTSVGADQVPALIDELPLLAVAMAAADGTSEVRGAGELRVKESDRIATIAAALVAAGAKVEELPDGWRIRRGRPHEAQIETRGDHRIAIASAVAAWAGVAKSVTIDDPACVAVSYPTFWADAEAVSSK